MAVNQMAVRMAGRDIEVAKQYIDLAIATLDRADQILATESNFRDGSLKLSAAQTKALLRETMQLADSFGGINTKPLVTYTPAEELEAVHA